MTNFTSESALRAPVSRQAPHAPPRRIVPVPRVGNAAELSFAQERLWVLDQLTPGLPVYNMSGGAHITGPFDIALWERILTEVVRRHEALRTIFVSGNGHRAAVILPSMEMRTVVADLRGDPQADARKLLLEEARRPFDLNTGPLLRSLVVRTAERECFVLLTMHHIVSDGLSTAIVFQEVGELYSAYLAGRQPRLPELAAQYADFAHWQRRWLDRETVEAQSAYWKQQLEGMATVLDLPADRPRPQAQSTAGARYPMRMSARLTAALRDFSRAEGVTLFTTLLVAFGALLSRYSRQRDFAIGTPVAGREYPETKYLIGCFLNTLALRMDLKGDPTVRELLRRVKETILGAFSHQELPFEKVVDALQIERAGNVSPLFQTMFSLEAKPATGLEIPGLSMKFEEIETGTSKVDLMLELTDEGTELAGWLEYNPDLFNRSTVVRMAAHLEMLLEQMTREPERRVGELRLMKRAELSRITCEWNDTAAAYPAQASIHEVFERQAAATPDHAAVRYGGKSLTYAELNRRANRLARRLRSSGAGGGQPVAMCLERSPEMVTATLAILKGGAAYVPLDAAYPRERVEFMLTDTKAPVLLTTRRLLDRLPPFDGSTVLLDDESECGEENLGITVDSRELAYVMYTSGSTGRPKGIGIPHRAVTRLVLNSNYVRLRPDDRVGQTSNICFDAATFEIWGALLNGATLVGISKEVALAPRDFAAQLREEGITALFLTTALFNRMAAEAPEAFAGLRHLLFGGEASDAASIRKILSHTGRPERLIHVYGPTESTTFATWHEIEGVAPSATTVPIGTPLANTRLYVVDDVFEPVPPGVTGELVIGGDGLARGYVARPELTAEKFVPDPFATEAGARLYRTGDLARQSEDGVIEFVGRNDHQVKIRGFRIELGEIEAALRAHPLVRECAVLARQDIPGTRRLVAYLAADTGALAEVRAHLRERLPEYMIPAAWVTMGELPLNSNGKVDRRAQPAPDGSRREQESPYLAPSNRVEERIAEIWSAVLGLEQVGVHDNFFELGGDSILAIQAAARCHRAGLALTPAQMMQHQTIAALAAVAGDAPANQAGQAPVTGAVPLTPIQRWFFEEDLEEPHHWNQAVLLEMEPGTDPAHAERALAALEAHHDALRLRFHRTEHRWSQEIAPAGAAVPFTIEDFAELKRRAAELQAGLNLQDGPLLRGAWFEPGDGTGARLLIAIHHLAVDGVSWRILLEDFATALQQQARGEEIRLPLKTTSFQRWSELLQECAASGALESETPYWISQCGPEMPDIPVDFKFRLEENTRETTEVVRCGLTAEETSALLHKAPQAWHAQTEELLLAAFARAFGGSVALDLEGHGREEIPGAAADVSRTVGWFTSVAPLRLTLGDDGMTHLAKSVRAVKEQVRRRPRRGFGYGILLYLAGSVRPQAEPRVAFNYLGQFDSRMGGIRMAKESCGPVFSPRGRRRHLIEVNGMAMAGELRFEWTYSTRAHRRATVEALAERFAAELRAIADNSGEPDAAILVPSDFPLAELDARKLDRVASLLARGNRENRRVVQ